MALTQRHVDLLTPDLAAPAQAIDLPVEVSTSIDVQGPRGTRQSWTRYLMYGEFADQVIAQANEIEGAWHAGIGLVNWKGLDVDFFGMSSTLRLGIEESGYVWGAVIYTSLLEKSYVLSEFSTLNFVEQSFPIIVRQAWHVPEALKVVGSSQLLGTATCWAKGRASNAKFPNTKGSLTASHVVGTGRHRVTIDDSGTLYRASNRVHAPPCIDAVFLDTGWPSSSVRAFTPQHLSSLAYLDPVSFSGAVSSGVTGYVTNISAHAKYSGSGIPMIMCHDGLGQNGDSGSMVDVNGQHTAMHLSKIALDLGGHESRTILLQQIERQLDADLYI